MNKWKRDNRDKTPLYEFLHTLVAVEGPDLSDDDVCKAHIWYIIITWFSQFGLLWIIADYPYLSMFCYNPDTK